VTLVAVDVNLFCQDPAALMGFYQALLGLPENAAARSPIYRALRLGEAELGFNKTDAYALLGLADRIPGDAGVTAYTTFVVADELRWSPSIGRFGDLDKLGPGCRQAANFSTSRPPYASSGVCPANALWGRLVL
jgi:hypothetical protein